MNTDTGPQQGCNTTTFKWVLGGLAVVAAVFAFTEHRAHLFGVLPYLVLLSCPLLHVFMHRGHGKHRHQEEQGQRPASEADSAAAASKRP